MAFLALPVVFGPDADRFQVYRRRRSGFVTGDRRPFGRCNPWRPLGYQIGSWGGRLLLRKLRAKPDSQKLIDSALDYVEKQGALGIFLTRWLLTRVGPWANFAAAATGYPPPALHPPGGDGRGGLNQAILRPWHWICWQHSGDGRYGRLCPWHRHWRCRHAGLGLVAGGQPAGRLSANLTVSRFICP